ncbi:hypothetical protein LPJ59_000599 [Coemansia sp. RSA 2399]|nr:hypothetical protein LPJ59_000599 [Coemansia sp. RSA 2399]KAJ1908363.1 hypothetical protein LPJ81_000154 [Coemansia sp. IMI 209127]
MSNTAISPAAMHAVLRQLPQMSGKIVDDTRHEKVLSYMRLFLASPDAIAKLSEWDALQVLSSCLQQPSDYRVSAVAIRFLGDIVSAPGALSLWHSVASEPHGVLRWVAENVDSQHALLRFSCLYFVRMAASIDDARVAEFLDQQLDYPRYITRRLLDAGSYFVVAEACKLLGALVCRHGQLDRPLCDLFHTLVARPFASQSAARKLAVLAAASTLYGTDDAQVHRMGLQTLTVDKLAPYLFASDRLVRDRALDVLENTLRLADDPECLATVVCILTTHINDASVSSKVRAATVLRILAAVVKESPVNRNWVGVEAVATTCKAIVGMALALLCTANDMDAEPTERADLAEVYQFLGSLIDPMTQQGARSSILCEAARIVREYTTFDQHVVSVLFQLLDHKQVQANVQLLHLVLDSIVRSLRRGAKHSASGFSHLLALPGIITNFAIRAPGLKVLFDLAQEVIRDQNDYDVGLFAKFCSSLVQSIRERLADVEWEARDTALEFVSSVVRHLGWPKARCLFSPHTAHTSLIDDAALALDDPEEYVRASGAQLLAIIVDYAHEEEEEGDAEIVRVISGHKRLCRDGLAALLNDSEAFVKRAAFDLVYSLGTAAMAGRTETYEWVYSLSYPKLYQTADDPDFEVRVRCAKLLALLCRCWLRQEEEEEEEEEVEEGRTRFAATDKVADLQPGSLLIDMCRDASRYVRRVCVDELLQMKRDLGPPLSAENKSDAASLDGGNAGEMHLSKRQTVVQNHAALFYQKLCAIDFARLEGSLTAEHLYQEALDTQVERELMAESKAPNEGNNILDCY